ncbi:MAG: esterase family protein [Lewinellaceae bacterium]|nr:esterase family protein [Lewinellaceae bacterium]
METYPYSLDSERQNGIPQGALTRHLWQSKIYEGSYREYFVYVPAQYDGSQLAALMVFQDGKSYVREDGDFRVPVVFDNLIHKKEMPLTIGLFINPGHHKSKLPVIPYQCSRRSWEYDDLSDQYARFLIEEMIPELQKNYTLADDPKMRAICGLSSGAICAFTVAWERPDYFHKVLSHIGSYTDIRGGHVYPALIRKSAKRDIKVFLQDGANDLDNRFGNWWLANQQMAAALAFRHYDYQFAGGTGGHDGKHGGAILPDSLRWLWADYLKNGSFG